MRFLIRHLFAMDAKAQIVSLGRNWDTEMLTKPRLHELHVTVSIEDM